MTLSSQFRLVVGSTSYTAADILSGVTITWGRGSLYDAPQKRTLTAEVATGITGLFARARDMTGRTATAYLDGEVVFTGSLADVATRRLDDTRVVLKFSAHETLGMNPLLGTIVNTHASSVTLLRQVIPLYVPSLTVHIEDMRPDHDTVKNKTFQDIQVKRLAEALACPSLISYPAWSPTYHTVRSTLYRPPRSSATIVPVAAGDVAVDAPTFSLKNFPGTIHYTMGTVYGEQEDHYYIARPDIPGEIDVPVAVNWDDFVAQTPDSDAIENAQISDPLVLTFSDARTPARELFTTWENPSSVVKISGFTADRSPLLTTAKNLDLILIGGQLTFTSHEVTHRTRAVYLPTSYTPLRYSQLPGPYKTLTGQYKEL